MSATNSITGLSWGQQARNTGTVWGNQIGALLNSAYFTLNNFKPSAPQYQSHRDSVVHNFNSVSKEKKDKDMNTEKGISLLQDGYVRQNRYLVEITPPPVLSGNSGDKAFNINKVGLLCNSVSLPAKMIQVYEHKNLGIPYRVPFTVNFDPIPMTFICDRKMEIRRFFDSWQKGIVDERNGLVNFYDEFKTTVNIHILDAEGYIIYTVKLTDAYPMMLSNLDLSYSSNNTPLVMSVTLAYRYWNEVYRRG